MSSAPPQQVAFAIMPASMSAAELLRLMNMIAAAGIRLLYSSLSAGRKHRLVDESTAVTAMQESSNTARDQHLISRPIPCLSTIASAQTSAQDRHRRFLLAPHVPPLDNPLVPG